jgi:nitroreductase
MEFDELANLIKSRRSIRKWQDKPVSEELLLKALELATWAPNGGNKQNWRFYIIENKNTIKAIAEAVVASNNKVVSWPESKKFKDMTPDLGIRSSFFRHAPVLIAVAAAQYQSTTDMVLEIREKTDAEAKTIRQWRNTANTRIQSVASAIAYLLLILHQMGLGAVWMAGPVQAKGEIEKILKIPEGLDVVAFIPVGYPAESPEPRERKPVREACEIVK